MHNKFKFACRWITGLTLACTSASVVLAQTSSVAHATPAASCTDAFSVTLDSSKIPEGRYQPPIAVLDIAGGTGVTVDWGGTGTSWVGGIYKNGGPDLLPGTPGQVFDYPATPGNMSFLYDTPGVHTVRICGTATRLAMPKSGIQSINSFGQLGTTNWSGAFDGDPDLATVPKTLPAGATDLSRMLSGTKVNSDLSQWDTSRVTTMAGMFAGDTAFNQPIGRWNTANVTTMSDMFDGATSFNQPIGRWNTANVTTMSDMFNSAVAFNKPIGAWNTGNVEYMQDMFESDLPVQLSTGMTGFKPMTFNQPLGRWNTGRVTNMSDMFSNGIFNQPVSQWDTRNVVDFSDMFPESFNQNLAGWSMKSAQYAENMFSISTANYDRTLQGWAARSDQPKGLTFSCSSTYSATGAKARASLVSHHGWTISDGGLA